jgi:hypothetical protein
MQPSEIHFDGASYFSCPSCGEKLQYSIPFTRSIWVCSFLINGGASYLYGIRGLAAGLATVGGTILSSLVIISVASLFAPPKLVRANLGVGQVRVRDGDVSLDLNRKPRP